MGLINLGNIGKSGPIYGGPDPLNLGGGGGGRSSSPAPSPSLPNPSNGGGGGGPGLGIGPLLPDPTKGPRKTIEALTGLIGGLTVLLVVALAGLIGLELVDDD